MNASKEECRGAIITMTRLKDSLPGSLSVHADYVLDVLKVAEKKLPSEESIAKDKERKKPPKNKSTNRTLKGGLS